ncbi:MAG: ABC transporter permease [Eubacterium sp.]|nr:ABC transporter permease [Eubacterium sp.]
MSKYIGRRFINSIAILIVATICIFAMVKASGMNPVLATLQGGRLSETALQDKLEHYGLDKPVPLQYLYWLKNIVTGNFGESVKYKVPVKSLIQTSLPITLGLAIISFIVSQILAITLGVISAVNRGKLIDKIISILTVLFFSIPVFFLSLLYILIIAKHFPGYSYTGSFNTFGEYLNRITIPVVVIATHEIALVTKITRTAMIEQLSSEYILALKARGIPTRIIIWKHALKNSLVPVITIAGVQFGALIVGCVMVENIFSLNGIGRLMVQCVMVGDISVIQCIALIIIVTFLISNLVVDALYAVIDPRVRLRKKN